MAEITRLEKELDDLDISDANNPDMAYRLRRNEWYEGWDTTQRDLLEKLRTKLLEYGKLLALPHSRLLNRNTELSTNSFVGSHCLVKKRLSEGQD
jgi:hypothetical protein